MPLPRTPITGRCVVACFAFPVPYSVGVPYCSYGNHVDLQLSVLLGYFVKTRLGRLPVNVLKADLAVHAADASLTLRSSLAETVSFYVLCGEEKRAGVKPASFYRVLIL